jgi:hypothetical protein
LPDLLRTDIRAAREVLIFAQARRRASICPVSEAQILL